MPEGLAIVPLDPCDLPTFKRDMQEAFRRGAEAYFGPCDAETLPEADIDASLAQPTAMAYGATVNERPAGGAIVTFSDDGCSGHLDFLFVRVSSQSKGTGQAIWHAIEALYPKVEVWETCTPYFDKRNVHFYINALGFSAVEFYNERHPDPHNGSTEPMFRFEKRIRI